MNEKELRIGNIVSIENKEVEVDGKLIFQLEKSNFVGCDTSDLKPIPLTEEWLLGFGFKNGEKNIFSFTKYMDLRIIGNENDYNGLWIGNILYVHSLQNLYFALTGDELTLNK